MRSFYIKFLILLFIILFADKPIYGNSGKQIKKNQNYIGIIVKITMFPKTLSEYSYYILKSNTSSSSLTNEIILFNKETNNSRGFDEYIDKKVKITGKEIMGFIGWRKEAKPGILVEKIKIIN